MLNKNPSSSLALTFSQLKEALINHIKNADIGKNKPEADSAMITKLHRIAQNQCDNQRGEGQDLYKRNEAELIIAFCCLQQDASLDFFQDIEAAYRIIQCLKDDEYDPHFALLLEACMFEHGLACEPDVIKATQCYAALAAKATDTSAYYDKTFPNLIVKASLARLYKIAELSEAGISEQWCQAKKLAEELAFGQLLADLSSSKLGSKSIVSREQTDALLKKVKTNHPQAYILLAIMDEKDKYQAQQHFIHASQEIKLDVEPRLFAAVANENLNNRYQLEFTDEGRTLANLLAQMNDENRLYRALDKGEIEAHYLKFKRVCKLDALARNTIIAHLCELSLTKETNADKIKAIFNIINMDKTEPGEIETNPAACRQQVLTFWHKQAAAPEAPEALIDAWNTYYRDNADTDYKSIADTEDTNESKVNSAIIQASQAHLAEIVSCKELTSTQSQAYKKAIKKEQYIKARRHYLSNDSKADEIEKLLVRASTHESKPFLLSALIAERRGNNEQAFRFYWRIAEDENRSMATRRFAAFALAKIGQEHGYTVNNFSASGEKISNFSPLFRLYPREFLRRKFFENKGVSVEMEEFGLTLERRTITLKTDPVLLKYLNTTVRHSRMLRDGASFLEMKAWSESCAENINSGPPEERQRWQNYQNELIARMFSRAKENPPNETFVMGWKDFCESKQNDTDNLIIQYTRAYYIENPRNRFSRANKSAKAQAKEIYEQLAKKGEPMALERLVSMSDNCRGEFKSSEDLARVYFLVNPERKPQSDYTIKPNIRKIASEIAQKVGLKITDASPEARGIYAKYLGYKMQAWYNGIANDSKHAEQKIYAIFLSFLANKDYAMSPECFLSHLLPVFRFDKQGEALNKAVSRFCQFIEGNVDMITVTQIKDLREILQSMEKSVNWFGLAKKTNLAIFKKIPPNFKDLWVWPLKKINHKIDQALSMKERQAPAIYPECPDESNRETETMSAKEELIIETDMANSSELRVQKVGYQASAPPEGLLVEERVLPPETNPDFEEFEQLPQPAEASSIVPSAKSKISQTGLPNSSQMSKRDGVQQEEGVLRTNPVNNKTEHRGYSAVVIHEMSPQAVAADGALKIKDLSITSALITPMLQTKLDANDKHTVNPRATIEDSVCDKLSSKQSLLDSGHKIAGKPVKQDMPSVPKTEVKKKVVQLA